MANNQVNQLSAWIEQQIKEHQQQQRIQQLIDLVRNPGASNSPDEQTISPILGQRSVGVPAPLTPVNLLDLAQLPMLSTSSSGPPVQTSAFSLLLSALAANSNSSLTPSSSANRLGQLASSLLTAEPASMPSPLLPTSVGSSSSLLSLVSSVGNPLSNMANTLAASIAQQQQLYQPQQSVRPVQAGHAGSSLTSGSLSPSFPGAIPASLLSSRTMSTRSSSTNRPRKRYSEELEDEDAPLRARSQRPAVSGSASSSSTSSPTSSSSPTAMVTSSPFTEDMEEISSVSLLRQQPQQQTNGIMAGLISSLPPMVPLQQQAVQPLLDSSIDNQRIKKSRRIKSPHQLAALRVHYQKNRKPKKAEIRSLVPTTGLTYGEISRWFRNERHKEKKERIKQERDSSPELTAAQDPSSPPTADGLLKAELPDDDDDDDANSGESEEDGSKSGATKAGTRRFEENGVPLLGKRKTRNSLRTADLPDSSSTEDSSSALPTASPASPTASPASPKNRKPRRTKPNTNGTQPMSSSSLALSTTSAFSNDSHESDFNKSSLSSSQSANTSSLMSLVHAATIDDDDVKTEASLSYQPTPRVVALNSSWRATFQTLHSLEQTYVVDSLVSMLPAHDQAALAKRLSRTQLSMPASASESLAIVKF